MLDGDRQSGVTQQRGQVGGTGRIVVDDEGAQAGGDVRARRAHGGRVHAHQDREPERGADPDRARHARLSAHEPGQLTGDGQAEAGAAVGPRGRGVGLLELLEHRVQLAGGNADTGVRDREAQPNPIAVRLVERHANHHLSGGRELDGVADQVGDDLADAGGVAADPERHVGVDVAHQLEALLVGTQRQRARQVLQHRRQFNRGVFDGEVTGFDLREVEHVVDHGQQRLATGADGLGEAPLFLVETGVEQQAHHAEHTVDRRANLVAHVGEELALGGAGGLGGGRGLARARLGGQQTAMRVAHVLVGGTAIADVLERAGQAHHGAVPELWGAHHTHPDVAVRGRDERQLEVERHAEVDGVLHRGGEGGPGLWCVELDDLVVSRLVVLRHVVQAAGLFRPARRHRGDVEFPAAGTRHFAGSGQQRFVLAQAFEHRLHFGMTSRQFLGAEFDLALQQHGSFEQRERRAGRVRGPFDAVHQGRDRLAEAGVLGLQLAQPVGHAWPPSARPVSVWFMCSPLSCSP